MVRKEGAGRWVEDREGSYKKGQWRLEMRGCVLRRRSDENAKQSVSPFPVSQAVSRPSGAPSPPPSKDKAKLSATRNLGCITSSAAEVPGETGCVRLHDSKTRCRVRGRGLSLESFDTWHCGSTLERGILGWNPYPVRGQPLGTARALG